MNLTVTIDLDDIYFDEDGSLSDAITYAIKNELTREIVSTTRSFVDVHIKSVVDAQIQTIAKDTVGALIESFTPDTLIKLNSYDSATMTLRAYVEKQITSHISGGALLNDAVKKQVSTEFEAFKNRYDAVFASHLISKLNEKGMLAANISQLILDK